MNNIFRKGQKLLFNNKTQKDKYIFEKNNNIIQNENSLKAKKLNEKTEINTNKNNEKDMNIKYTESKISENKNNFQLNDSSQKKIELLPIIKKKKSMETYDNLPLINLRIETKIEPILP